MLVKAPWPRYYVGVSEMTFLTLQYSVSAGFSRFSCFFPLLPCLCTPRCLTTTIATYMVPTIERVLVGAPRFRKSGRGYLYTHFAAEVSEPAGSAKFSLF